MSSVNKKKDKKKMTQASNTNVLSLFFYKIKNLPLDRITTLAVVMGFFSCLILWRLFNLQVVEHGFYKGMATERDAGYQNKDRLRGHILVHDGPNNEKLFPVSVNRDLHLLYGVPKEIESPARTARKIAKVLEIENVEPLENKLAKEGDPYERIMGKLEPDIVEEIEDLEMEGVHFSTEKWRYYPSGDIFSHVTGFMGFVKNERQGIYGVEGFFNDILSGKNSSGWIQKLFSEEDISHQNPNLVLTIDRGVQFFACKKLEEYVKRFDAKSGNVLILNPSNGAVMALCNYPSFDPNHYSEVEDATVYNNAAIFNAFEPGSTFKAVTMAAALDANVINPGTTYLDEGVVEIGKYKIRNVNSLEYGEQNMTEVLEKSLNTGAIYAANKVGFDSFKRYLYDFGFGEKTGIDLDYESRGDLSSLKRKSQIYLATASFGQGITVTPLQMVNSFAAIANGGKLYKPYILEEVIYPQGEVDKREPEFLRQVISPRAATLAKGMLVSVVHNGHAKGAFVPGYYIGGKTGTAQLHDKSKGGYSDKTIQSFVGFGPVDEPVFSMITKLDEPANSEFASESAAPLFGEIAKFLLEYYQVPRDY